MGVRVSVMIAVFNGEAFVAEAVRSALVQTMADIEVLVADNGSTDGTWSVLQRLAGEDPRVRPLRASAGRGPDVARNACMDLAVGEWLAVLDADDVMHPARLERLLSFADRRGARVVGDNQRLVDQHGRFLRLAWRPEDLPAKVDAAEFVRWNRFGQRRQPLGYVKPLFRRELVANGLRYRAKPRVVEDYMFMFELLRQEAALHLTAEPLYDYFQMPGSLSHDFRASDLADVQAANQLQLADPTLTPRLRAALRARQRSIDAALAHAGFVAALKARRLDRAFSALAAHPAAVPLVLRFGGESLGKRVRRLRGKAAAEPAAEPAAVAFFGQDCTDNAVIRRITAFQAAGHPVLGLTFRREKFNRDYQPTWDNVPLGQTRDRHYRDRLHKLWRAAWMIFGERHRLAAVSLFYARNIDMALLAMFGRLVSGARAPLVYEVLDVQRAFIGNRWQARLLRWVERRILAAAQLLVVSSPGFVDAYYLPVQRYAGEWFLLENKILGAQLRAMGEAGADLPGRLPGTEGRLVIGWFGTLRCTRSLALLAEIAAALPDRVVVYLRGFPTETGLGPFLEVVERHPNMIYGGEFFSPRDLPALYAGIDFAWGFDFLDAGGNSDWLLPNRLYDAGYFHVPLLAAAGTQTGRRVAELGMGRCFEAPYGPAIIAFLNDLTEAEKGALKEHLAALPRALFCEEDDTIRLIRRLLSPAAGVSAVPSETMGGAE